MTILAKLQEKLPFQSAQCAIRHWTLHKLDTGWWAYNRHSGVLLEATDQNFERLQHAIPNCVRVAFLAAIHESGALSTSPSAILHDRLPKAIQAAGVPS